jgi:hypothetical protein
MKEPIELGPEECRRLLSTAVIGRLAIITPAGPRIMPLNFTTIGETLVFRTTPYSEIARYAIGTEAAFEVDDLNHQQQTGWSVLAVGRIEEVPIAELQDLRTVWVPRPWAGGLRNAHLRLTWRQLTGRRLRGELSMTVPQRPLP